MFTDYIAYVCELHGFDAIEKDLKNRWSACCVKGQGRSFVTEYLIYLYL